MHGIGKKRINYSETNHTSAVRHLFSLLSPWQISNLLDIYKFDFHLFGYKMSKYEHILSANKDDFYEYL